MLTGGIYSFSLTVGPWRLRLLPTVVRERKRIRQVNSFLRPDGLITPWPEPRGQQPGECHVEAISFFILFSWKSLLRDPRLVLWPSKASAPRVLALARLQKHLRAEDREAGYKTRRWAGDTRCRL